MDTIVTLTGTLLITGGLLAGPVVIDNVDASAHTADVIATCTTLDPDYAAAADELGLHPVVWNVEHGLTTVTTDDLRALCPELVR